MSKHTPGPWKTELVRHAPIAKEFGVYRLFDCKHRNIALIERRFDSPETAREANANANLIAAAPDLLEALEAVLSVADRATDEFDLARKAIARAKGESQ